VAEVLLKTVTPSLSARADYVVVVVVVAVFGTT
jgi:hypothetical protein